MRWFRKFCTLKPATKTNSYKNHDYPAKPLNSEPWGYSRPRLPSHCNSYRRLILVITWRQIWSIQETGPLSDLECQHSQPMHRALWKNKATGLNWPKRNNLCFISYSYAIKCCWLDGRDSHQRLYIIMIDQGRLNPNKTQQTGSFSFFKTETHAGLDDPSVFAASHAEKQGNIDTVQST